MAILSCNRHILYVASAVSCGTQKRDSFVRNNEVTFFSQISVPSDVAVGIAVTMLSVPDLSFVCLSLSLVFPASLSVLVTSHQCL